MVNKLSQLRADIANTLNEAGIRSVDYGETKIVPPLAMVIPHDDYISLRSEDGFGQFNIGIRVLILGPKASASVAANSMDDLIIKAVIALNDDFDIVGVSAPGTTDLNGVSYFGSVIDIDAQIILREDN